MKDITFYPNQDDNMHCSQAVFRSLFKYFLNKELSWNEIDRITKTIPGKAPWTMAAHIELAKSGVKIVNIEPFDYQHFYKEGVAYLKQSFDPTTVKYYLEQSNLLEVKEDIPKFLKLVKHESRKATIKDIDDFLTNGYLVAAEINSRVFNKKPGFSLHFVLIKSCEYNTYTINDPGLPPIENRVTTKQELIDALNGSSNGEVSAFIHEGIAP